MSAETNRIDAMFAAKREAGERAMIFFLTAGFPNAAATLQAIDALEEAGADMIELGIPFSDPVADGPTIQAASQAALESGMSVRGAIEIARRARAKSQIPIVMFTALNPIRHYGLEKFADDARAAGADGILVPDVPADESKELIEVCAPRGLKLPFLAAPTSTPDRCKMIAERSTGFVYYISLRGVTGAREGVAADLEANVARLKAAGPLPVVVGFGVSRPEHVRRIGGIADGLVVGSALVDEIGKHAGGPQFKSEIAGFARSLVEALPRRSAAVSA